MADIIAIALEQAPGKSPEIVRDDASHLRNRQSSSSQGASGTKEVKRWSNLTRTESEVYHSGTTDLSENERTAALKNKYLIKESK